MKTMTYKKLMAKCEDGYAEVIAWSGDLADVRFFKSNGTSTRQIVQVTNIPAEI